MSIWKQPSKTGEGSWGDPNVTWGSDSVSWGAILSQWVDQNKNTSVFTLEEKNIVDSTEQKLLIGEGFFLDIGSGFNLLIQAGGAGYSLQSKNTSSYTLQPISDLTDNYYLDIGEGFNLLIGEGHKLLIESKGDNWQLQTKN